MATAQPHHPLMRSRNPYPVAAMQQQPQQQSVGAVNSNTALPFTRPSRNHRSRRHDDADSTSEEHTEQAVLLGKAQAYANMALVFLLGKPEYVTKVAPNTFMATVVYYPTGSQTLLMQVSPGNINTAAMMSINIGSYETLKSLTDDELKDKITEVVKAEAEKKAK